MSDTKVQAFQEQMSGTLEARIPMALYEKLKADSEAYSDAMKPALEKLAEERRSLDWDKECLDRDKRYYHEAERNLSSRMRDFEKEKKVIEDLHRLMPWHCVAIMVTGFVLGAWIF